jgi:hypothetical protein
MEGCRIGHELANRRLKPLGHLSVVLLSVACHKIFFPTIAYANNHANNSR